jgi:2-oxoisovalerate dehydrogenase E1 component alpha subunit
MTGYGPLKLHVPEPAVRPGGTPDFSSVRIPRAGSVARPAVDADPEAIRDLAYSIIRVLSRDGRPSGPWAGHLSDEALLAGLRFDAARFRRAHADGAAAGQDVVLHAAHG